MLGRSPPSALDASMIHPFDASLELHDMMTDPDKINKNYTLVQRVYKAYDPIAWMNLINNVNKEFGRSGKRWQWIMNNELSVGNAWVVDFYFEHPHDATMFQLKY